MASIENHLTLSALAARLSEAVATAFSKQVWVVAEISECKVGGSGHCYLSLVERAQEGSSPKAEMRAAIWASKYRLIEGYFRQSTGLNLQAGLKVLVLASVDYHPVYGLSLNITEIDPTFTVGEGERQRRATIERLEKEGLMELQREFALPLVAQRYAIISSATAAGYEDFMKHLTESPYRVETELFEALMQGEATERSVVEALARIEARAGEFDAVVVVRGGGSASDLRWFDGYGICAALAQCSLPVLTGIGHEKDTSVADLVAYYSFKTPTAAASMIIERLDKVYQRFENLWAATFGAAESVLGNEGARLEAAVSGLGRWTAEVLRGAEGRLERLRSAMVVGASGAIEGRKRRVEQYASALESGALSTIGRLKHELSVRGGRIENSAQAALVAATSRLNLVQGALKSGALGAIGRAKNELSVRGGRIENSAQAALVAATNRLNLVQGVLKSGALGAIGRAKNELSVSGGRVRNIAKTVLVAATNRLNLVQGALGARAVAPIDRARGELARRNEMILNLATSAVERHKAHLNLLTERIEGRNPRAILAMGYAMAKTSDGLALKRVADAPKGTHLSIEVADGTIQTEVL